MATLTLSHGYPASQESKLLSMVDWDFSGRMSHGDIEGLHPYPAKFIAEIPRTLLEILPVPFGTRVLDPFCGSGTTLVESQRLGMSSVGIDLNPIASLITRVKTAPLPIGIEQAAKQTTDYARCINSVHIPTIPNLDHWFKKPIQSSLAACTAAIAATQPEYQDILRLALSSIIVRMSNQESDTRYAAVSKAVEADDVFSHFASAVKKTISVLSDREYSLISSTVINDDTLSLSTDDISHPVGIAITSPPYPNAYEYWLYHKYRMWWLGFDPLAVKQREIGARAHFFKRNPHTPDHFRMQMATTFNLLRSVVIQGGFVCFLIGRSKIHGRIIDNGAIIESVALSAGFAPVFKCERAISSRRKSFNLSHAKIKTETLLVLRRTGVAP